MEKVDHTGGCQCGALRYRITAPLSDSLICHCRMCQKAFGSFGAALIDAPEEHFTWTRGQPSTFMSSSIVTRGFCSACGTPMFMKEDSHPFIELAIGTLDNPNAIPALTRQSGVESKVHWFDQMFNLPSEATEDYRTPEDLKKLKSFQHPDHD